MAMGQIIGRDTTPVDLNDIILNSCRVTIVTAKYKQVYKSKRAAERETYASDDVG